MDVQPEHRAWGSEAVTPDKPNDFPQLRGNVTLLARPPRSHASVIAKNFGSSSR